MPNITEHQSAKTTKLLLLGDSGCLAGNTGVSVTRGNSKSKVWTLDHLYKAISDPHPRFDKSLDTFLQADLGGYVGLAKMLKIIKSGRKKVKEIVVDNRTIWATDDHLFKTPYGWAKLEELSIGDPVIMWRASRNKEFKNKEISPLRGRAVVYSIPFHPFAQANWVAGKDYKRLPKARLIIEAAMNGIPVDELIRILRNDNDKAAQLDFLPEGVDVHHLDGDYTNDVLENLHVLDRQEHIMLHQEDKVKESKGTHSENIRIMSDYKEMMTYDIVMEGPHHNFVANGFVVHNSGKTGALMSLAAAGYNLRILDFDNGIDIIKGYCTSKQSSYLRDCPGIADRIDYLTLTDTMKNVAGQIYPIKAVAWQRGITALDHWKEYAEDGKTLVRDLGKLTSWTPQDVLVIDSLTMLAQAALNFHLGMNGKLGTTRTQNEARRDIGAAQNLLRRLLEMLYDESVKCNVIVISHITMVTEQGLGPQGQETGNDPDSARGYPSAIGRALSPLIPRYFNSVLEADVVGHGASAKHKIYTRTRGNVLVKTSAPLSVKSEYPLESGLAEYFKAVKEGT